MRRLLRAWRRFTSWLFATQKEKPKSFDFSQANFPPAKINEIAKELGITKRAILQAKNELPRSTDPPYDGPQRQIITYIEGEISTITSESRNVLSRLTHQIENFDLTIYVTEISTLAGELKKSLNNHLEHGTTTLKTSRDASVRMQSQLDQFRRDSNLLLRQAEFPDSHFKLWALLVMLVFLESIGNAYFFMSDGLRSGLDGFAMALVLAVVDITVVFNLGKLVRFCNHIHLGKKAFGLLCGLACSVWVVCYNLIVAHFREINPSSEYSAMTMAFTRFQENPLVFDDGTTWFLVILGALFSIFAILDGYYWDDPYPGYGKLVRTQRELEDEYNFHRKDVDMTAEELRQTFQARVRDIPIKAHSHIVGFQNAVQTRAVMSANIRAFVLHYQQCCNTLLQMYQDENQRTRTTAPPTYFNQRESWIYETIPVLADNLDRDNQRLAEANEIIQTLNISTHEAIEMIDGLHLHFCNKLRLVLNQDNPEHA
jgi:hypothetical protein